MREVISRLSKGMIDEEPLEIELSTDRIEDSIPVGQTRRGEFKISAAQRRRPLKGLVYSTDPRVVTGHMNLNGLSAAVSFEVTAWDALPGETIEGEFQIVTNDGEYALPYRFAVTLAEQVSHTETLESFRDLALEEPEKALRLFSSRNFTQLTFMKDLDLSALYRGLTESGPHAGALEEFLVASGMKKPVTVQVDTAPRTYTIGHEAFGDDLVLVKNGWGFFRGSVTPECDFLYLDREWFTQDNFNGNSCRLPFHVNIDRLHAGMNYGGFTVALKDEHYFVPVNVRVAADGAAQANALSYMRHRVAFIREYLDYQESGELEKYLPSLYHHLEAMGGIRELPLPLRLTLAEINARMGRRDQAMIILENVKGYFRTNRADNLDMHCFYLYTKALAQQDEEQMAMVEKILRKYVDEGADSDPIVWLLIRVSATISSDPAQVWQLVSDRIAKGAHSPFLYSQGFAALVKEPKLLSGLNNAMIRTLNYAAKRGILREDMAILTASEFDGLGYEEKPALALLTKLYETYPRREILHAICATLIFGDRKDEEAFPWYEKAVAGDLEITRLYEYYLASLPDSFVGVLPECILRYYSYNNTLDDKTLTTLYTNILRFHRNDPQLFGLYEQKIESFALDQLVAGKVNDRLARLYELVLHEEIVDEKLAQTLPQVLFTGAIVTARKGFVSVAVCYPELNRETVVKMENGRAFVPLYTEDCRIVFVDESGSRCANVPYERLMLFDRPELAERCRQLAPDHLMLAMRESRRILQKKEVSEDDIKLLQELIGQSAFTDLYKKEMAARVLTYCTEIRQTKGEEEEKNLLSHLDYVDMEEADRIRYIEALIGGEYYDSAYENVTEHGYRHLPSARLTELCRHVALAKNFEKEDLLLAMCLQLFRAGVSDSTVLEYLCEYFSGGNEEMKRLLFTAEANHAQTYDLSERLIAQMLFSRCDSRLDDVFEIWIAGRRPSEMLLSAYFVRKSHAFFMNNQPIPDSVFSNLEAWTKEGLAKESVPLVCQLAVAKSYSVRAKLTDAQQDTCREIMDILLRRSLLFSFYYDLAERMELPVNISDKVILEYRGKQKKQPLAIRYRLTGANRWQSSELKPMYQEIYAKAFILFTGETLEYEICEVDDSGVMGPEVLAAGTLSGDRVQAGGGNRFQYLNSFTAQAASQDEEKLKERVLAYGELDGMAARLFYPL